MHPVWRAPVVVGVAAIGVLATAVGVVLTAEGGATRLAQRTGFSPGAGILSAPQHEVERELDAVVDSGARWIRLDVDWSLVEPEPQELDWSDIDRVIGSARDRGLEVLALLTYAPDWARPPGTSSHAPPEDPADFAAFAGAAAARYTRVGVLTYEIWNEPNIPQFWAPAPDVAEYVRLLQPASAAIRAMSPRATVLSGGLAPASDDGPGGQIDPRTFVEGLYDLGGGAALDAVAVHPYSFPVAPSQPGTAEFNTFQKLRAIRQTMVRAGAADQEVWLTEVGAPTGTAPQAVDEQRQAHILLDALRSADQLDWTGPVFLYAIRDAGLDPADREDNFGLLRRDFSPKPAWHAVTDLLHTRR